MTDNSQKQYIAIDLKSFYASVECVERGLNPLDTCLVVADQSRTDKTICLAVSPALKSFGLPGRPRLFEVVQKIREVNNRRGKEGNSISLDLLRRHEEIAVDYIVAAPQMQLYIDYSARIYNIYLRYIAPEDIHVYSIDEVFIDATSYLATYKLRAHDLAMKMIREVLQETGITATAGIGDNLYLCKVAMDIVAKKMKPDKDGVRIAELDEIKYRRELWDHRPMTDFWRFGKGIVSRLEKAGIYNLGQLCRLSIKNEAWFYKEFGVNAELIIDHAWGREPVTIRDVKSYHPDSRSLSIGQVLSNPYPFFKGKIVAMEMADSISLDLVDQKLVTNQIVLTIGYDIENLTDSKLRSLYHGKVSRDHYGREVPYHAHGTVNFDSYTSSSKLILEKVASLFDRIVNPQLLIRRITLSINKLKNEDYISGKPKAIQFDLFTDYQDQMNALKKEKEDREKERKHQETIIRLRKQWGKNIILNGINFSEGATQRDRNSQIGGHKA
ncbi:MAG: DNA methylase [Muribaculaceae bacterium]|nr:DNA methylase [Muribaculaceae bacterium]